MTETHDLAHKQLQELRKLYLAALPEKINQLESDFLSCMTMDGASLMNFYRVVHSLAGSASIYSVTEVSEVARQIENLVHPMIHGGAGSAHWRQDTELLLEKLKSLSTDLSQV